MNLFNLLKQELKAIFSNSAKEGAIQGNASGILERPNHFYRDLLLGKSPILSYAGDVSYFSAGFICPLESIPEPMI